MGKLEDSSVPAYDPMDLVKQYQSCLVKLAHAETTHERDKVKSEIEILRKCWLSIKGTDNIHELASSDSKGD